MDKRTAEEEEVVQEPPPEAVVESAGNGEEEKLMGEDTSSDVVQRSVQKQTATYIRRSESVVHHPSPTERFASSTKKCQCPCEQCRNKNCDCRDVISDESWRAESRMAKAMRKEMAVKLRPVSPEQITKEDDTTLASMGSWTAELSDKGTSKAKRRGKAAARGLLYSPWFRNAAFGALFVGLVVTAVIMAKRSKS